MPHNGILHSGENEQLLLQENTDLSNRQIEGMEHRDEKCVLCTQPTWHAIQALPLDSWEILGNSFNHSVPLSKGHNTVCAPLS